MRKVRQTLAFMLVIVLFLTCLPFSGSHVSADEQNPTILVESTAAASGSKVNVSVNIKNNPGIAGAKLTLTYSDKLSLINAAPGDTFSELDYTAPDSLKNNCKFNWDSLDAEVTEDGVLLVLTFLISDSAASNEELNIDISYGKDDIYDKELNSLNFDVVNGGIRVVNYTPGDVNNDGIINGKDVTAIRRYNAGSSVSINLEAADVNDDGVINGKDVTLIRRYNAGHNVVLKPSTPRCSHELKSVVYKAQTCEEAGNTAYWYCTKCNKYFSNADASKEIAEADTIIPSLGGHTVVIDPAVPATTTSTGLTEGSHCSVCGKVIVAQKIVAMIKNAEYGITYSVAGNDKYLQNLNINNPNPNSYVEGVGTSLIELEVEGYIFEGWYDGQGSQAKRVTAIDKNDSGAKRLYAHWSKQQYVIQMKSDLFLESTRMTYSVDSGATLPTPTLSNYIFVGWTDDTGKLYSANTIPVGTTGNITLNANWTSERNKASTKKKLDAPIIYEDEENNVIYFAYEIGKIENVPLYTIHNFGYINGDGVTKTETKTYSVSTSESTMQSYAKAVAKATTQSSNWTLGEGWSDSTSIDKEWCDEKGISESEAKTIGTSDTGTWNISSSNGGSKGTTHVDSGEDGYQNEISINASLSSTVSAKTSVGVKTEAKAEVGYGVAKGSAGVSTEANTEFGASVTGSMGMETGGMDKHSTVTSDTTNDSSTWNSSSSYGGSKTNSQSATTSRALSEKISEKTGYGQQYIKSGDWSSSQGHSSTSTDNEEYSVSTTYNKSTSESHTSTWTTQSTKAGYHRWVVAGTAHVFAVVSYDIASKAYSVYTYSIMDDATHEFEDYSYTDSSFSDNQNGVISFAVPSEVAQYVADKTCSTDGLKVDQSTGEIISYTGTDTYVVIPEYMNIGNGDVVKVTGISKNAFSNNKNIVMVVLSDFITEIPDNAFENCTSLAGVIGGKITKIGDNAFSGCTSINELGIYTQLTSLGKDAFTGVKKLIAFASNSQVFKAAVESGADEIAVYAGYMSDGTANLSGNTLTVSDITKYFELNGMGSNYENVVLSSGAAHTVINKANFISSGKIPLQIASSKIDLNQVTVSSTGIAAILGADNTAIRVQGNVEISSENGNAVIAKSVSLSELNPSAAGKLKVGSKLYSCGTFTGTELLDGTIVPIDEAGYNKMIHSYTLYFNSNGGSCAEKSREVSNGTAIGTLPVPERQYYFFDGWYLEDGTSVTANSIFTTGTDQTVIAHWTRQTYILQFNTNASGVAISESNRIVNCGDKLGSLPTPTLDYYDFVGWYTTADASGVAVNADTIFETTNAVTIYAHWLQHGVSDWTRASEVPEGAQTVEQKWTYSKTTYTESTGTSVPGYECYDSYWVKSGESAFNYSREFPSGFDTNNDYYKAWNIDPVGAYENATNKRDVQTGWAGYIYYHWAINASYANTLERAVAPRNMTWNNWSYRYFYAFASATDCPYLGTTYSCSTNTPSYNCVDVMPDKSSLGTYTPRFFRFNYYWCAYQDYYKVFKYRRTDDNLESASDVSGQADVSNVVEWIRYRAR